MMETTTDTRDTLFLSEWIDLAALAATNKFFSDSSQWPADIRKSTALCSDVYLLSALRVALSLAEQICEAEDIAAQDENDGRGRDNGCGNYRGLPPLSPSRSSWARRIQIHLSSKNDGDTNNSLFCIENAIFLPASEKGHLKDSMQRMYSLGMVFYEMSSARSALLKAANSIHRRKEFAFSTEPRSRSALLKAAKSIQ